MGLLNNLTQWSKGWLRFDGAHDAAKKKHAGLRKCRFETMEERRMLDADPLAVGAVYIEADLGSDLHGDTFEITFEGGGAATELTRIVIDGDQNTPGFGLGDVFFDTLNAGYGADNAFPLTIVSQTGIDSVSATVIDGTSLLVIDFTGFNKGEKLVFSIDVDEVQSFDPTETDLNLINQDFDPITSGVEFQGSQFKAFFVSPHFQNIDGQGEFRNIYDVGSKLNLSPDNFNGQRDRTAGAIFDLHQQALPISISGTVYHDMDLDLTQDAGDDGIAGVTLSLWKKNNLGVFEDTTLTTTTDANGDYSFGTQLNLKPGIYRVVETQPTGFYSVGAVPGTVAGGAVGSVLNADALTEITIPLGGQIAIDYDFAEAQPASISGYVYHDQDNDGIRDTGEPGIAGVEIKVVPISTIATQSTQIVFTDANGFYEVTGLVPGTYDVIELVQPAAYEDGKDTAGTVNGVASGLALNDHIENIFLGGGKSGSEYNFGEIKLGQIHGNVHLSQPNGDCYGPGHPNHLPLAGVLITLKDQQGITLATTTTDANGDYWFTDLVPGTYTIVETTPPGLLDGADKIGTINGVTVGQLSGNDTITNIVLNQGNVGVEYDFCEHEPASISGYVYHDQNNDGIRDAAEAPIANTKLILIDSNGNQVTLTDNAGNPVGDHVLTDANGYYKFDFLSADTYKVVEFQPTGFLDGKDTAGTINAITVGQAFSAADEIRQVDLKFGEHGIEYNFGEVLPGSIQGIVHVDLNGNAIHDTGELLLENVTVKLLDSNGNLITTTQTDAVGHYLFDNLLPGDYSVMEVQPAGYFHGGQVKGSGNGDDSLADMISQITIPSGTHLIEYNFYEIPPATLSGFVFQDGGLIQTLNGQPPINLVTIRDGQLTSDDTRLAGVVLELRDGTTGAVITTSNALPGAYPAGPIQVVTDANGYYEFRGLKAGSYAVYEIQPAGYFDSIDTPGTTTGIAVNAHAPPPAGVLAPLVADPHFDAILQIPLGVGVHSQLNNFSEVRTFTPPPFEEPPEDPPEDPPLPPFILPAVIPPVLFVPPPEVPLLPIVGSGGLIDFTWHLSVVNAGRPRANNVNDGLTVADSTAWLPVSFLQDGTWAAGRLREGRWTLNADSETDGDGKGIREFVFGVHGAIPVSGDFNGDGIDETGVFYKGKWFIDLNGNGRWDESDLWSRLGAANDLPVVGDWDGDGKDDIGIFGPIWPGDPHAIEAEPGLPDSFNTPKDKPKNVPPKPEDATSGKRMLQLTSQGKSRGDLIDHVFHYGNGGDVPVSGDFNGDGIASIGIFRDGQWRLDTNGDGRLSGSDDVIRFGQAGDTPIVGDFDGDGVAEIGVYRAGKWMIDSNGDRELDAHDKVFELGGADDVPVVGDFNGDGIDQAGLYRDTGPALDSQARN